MSRQGMASVSRTSRSWKTMPQRTSNCSASASLSASRSSLGAGVWTIDQRPSPEERPLTPRRKPRGANPARAQRRPMSRPRTAANPSAVTSPRATPSHSADSTSDGSRRASVAMSLVNSAPCSRRARSTSCVAPDAGSIGRAAPRTACRSQPRSSRMTSVTGVAREGKALLRAAASSSALSRTFKRPHTTSPDRHS